MVQFVLTVGLNACREMSQKETSLELRAMHSRPEEEGRDNEVAVLEGKKCLLILCQVICGSWSLNFILLAHNIKCMHANFCYKLSISC